MFRSPTWAMAPLPARTGMESLLSGAWFLAYNHTSICRCLGAHPTPISTPVDTQRQTGKDIAFIHASGWKTAGQAAPEAQRPCWLSVPAVIQGALVLSIPQEDRALGRDRGMRRGTAEGEPLPSSLVCHSAVTCWCPSLDWGPPCAAGGVTAEDPSGTGAGPLGFPPHLGSSFQAGHCCLSSPQGPLSMGRQA